MKESSLIIDPLMQLPGIQPEQLMQLSLPTIRTDVNMPDKSGDILTHTVAWLPVISCLHMNVYILYIYSYNMLIIKGLGMIDLILFSFKFESGMNDQGIH